MATTETERNEAIARLVQAGISTKTLATIAGVSPQRIRKIAADWKADR